MGSNSVTSEWARLPGTGESGGRHAFVIQAHEHTSEESLTPEANIIHDAGVGALKNQGPGARGRNDARLPGQEEERKDGINKA